MKKTDNNDKNIDVFLKTAGNIITKCSKQIKDLEDIIKNQKSKNIKHQKQIK